MDGEQTRIQHAFSYSDGFGREIQKKIQAEPGPLVPGGAEVGPRWVGSGWTIFNNKGKPVRQYEPFFSATHRFEFARTEGVSPVLFYDPVGRVVATLHPNHTWEKVVFDPWRQETWDVNDTVLIADPKDDPDVADYFRRLPDRGLSAGLARAARRRRDGGAGAGGRDQGGRACRHAEHRPHGFAGPHVPDGGAQPVQAQRLTARRSAGRGLPHHAHHSSTSKATSARSSMRLTASSCSYDYDMLGNRIHSASMDAGERWTLNDVAGRALYGWDSRDHRLRTTYDVLGRPTERVPADRRRAGAAGRQDRVRREPAERRSDTTCAASRTRPSTAPVSSPLPDYDFKGNALSISRQLAVDYKTTPDWSTTVALEAEVFTTRTSFDALNRPVTQTTPDNSTIRRTYNEANLLETIDANLRGDGG